MVLPNKMSSFRLGVLFFVTLIEMTLFSAPLLGWSSLVFVLKAEGIYSHLCYDNHNSNISKPKDHFSRRFADKPCVEQEERLNFDATLSVLIGAIYIFICGWAIDRFGVKAIKIFSSVMYGISAGFFAITSAESPAMLIPALLVFTIGQVGVFLSAIRSVVLYGKWQASVNSVFCCSLSSSAVLFLIFKVLYEQGIAYQLLCYGFLCSCIVLVFNAVVLFPNIKNEPSGQATIAKDTKEKLMKSSPPNQKKGIWPKLAALKDLVVYMKSGVFIGSCLFIGICRLRLWFFVISFQQFMMALPKMDEESVFGKYFVVHGSHSWIVKSYANYYGMTQLCSVAVGPFVSALITATAEMFKRSGSYKQRSAPRLSSPQEKLGKACKCEVLGVTDAEETARAGEVRGCTVYFAFSGILFVLISSLTTIPNAPLQVLIHWWIRESFPRQISSQTFWQDLWNREFSDFIGANASISSFCHLGKLFPWQNPAAEHRIINAVITSNSWISVLSLAVRTQDEQQSQITQNNYTCLSNDGFGRESCDRTPNSTLINLIFCMEHLSA